MRTETIEFDYHLPKELIAQEPTENRQESSLLVLDRKTGNLQHKKFFEIIDYFNPGDLLVYNNTKVFPARLIGTKNGSKKPVEVLGIKKIDASCWETLIKPQRGLEPGTKIFFKCEASLWDQDSLHASIISKTDHGSWLIEFSDSDPFSKIGFAPLPPYIKRDYQSDTRHEFDRERYQTVYAANSGAIAAPTAGLHFTNDLLKKIEQKGIITAAVTLHVGIGTFRPVRAEYIQDHEMHEEWFSIPPETTEKIKKAKRIIAVGTTTTRVLETTVSGSGYTNAFIYPPYKFKVVNALITNFHLPKSNLLMLISAFADKELIMKAYQEAIKHKYRFYSYGDAMLIV